MQISMYTSEHYIFKVVKSVGPLKIKPVFIVFTEPHRRRLHYRRKLGTISVFWKQETATSGRICPIRSVFVPPHVVPLPCLLLPPSRLHMCISAKRASKVECRHCWINWWDAECDWLRGDDVTLRFWNSWWLGPARRGSHPESAGQRSKQDIRWGILEITMCAQGDGCYHVFVKKNE